MLIYTLYASHITGCTKIDSYLLKFIVHTHNYRGIQIFLKNLLLLFIVPQ